MICQIRAGCQTGAGWWFCIGMKRNDMMTKRGNDSMLSAAIGKLVAVFLLSTYVMLTAGHAFAADPDKVIHSVFEAADDGFDMVRTQNY